MLAAGGKFLHGAMKIAEDSGMMGLWDFEMAFDPLMQARDTASQFMEDSWNYSPNTYANLGYGIGSTAGSLGTAAFGITASRSYIRHSGLKAKGYSDAIKRGESVFLKNEQGILSTLKGRALSADNSKYITKMGTAGIANAEGKFIKPLLSTKWTIGGIAGSMVAGFAASYALSTVGSFVDQAVQADRNRKKMYYDSRYFNTQQQEESAYQTIGAAMDSYQMKMVNMARVFHSRG